MHESLPVYLSDKLASLNLRESMKTNMFIDLQKGQVKTKIWDMKMQKHSC